MGGDSNGPSAKSHVRRWLALTCLNRRVWAFHARAKEDREQVHALWFRPENTSRKWARRMQLAVRPTDAAPHPWCGEKVPKQERRLEVGQAWT
jgi:hypothetical protein